MTVALSRIRQAGIKIEGISGTAENLAAADFARNCKSIEASPSLTRYARGVLRAALTKLKDMVGGKIGEFTWQEELVGGTVSTEAPWYAPLQAAGTQKTTLKIITVGSITGGTFAAGDTVTTDAGATSGRVAWTGSVGGAVKIVLEPIAGTFNDTDVVTNGTASGTQSGAWANAGFSHRPMSENGSQTPPTATAEYRDPNYKHRLVGASCDVGLMFNWGEVGLMDVRVRGPRQIKDVDGTPLDPGLMTGITPPPAPGALMGDIGLPVKLDSWEGVISQLGIKFNNTITDRKTITTGGVIGYVTQGARCGYMPSRITDRRVEITIDPETPAEATKALMKGWQSNADFVFHAQTGKLLASGDKAICINVPKASLAQDAFAQQDREGINALGLTLLCTGVLNDDDEIYIDHVYIP